MTPVLKAEASPDFIEKIRALEIRSDNCYEDLRLLRHPWNLASWLSLSESIRILGGIRLSNPFSTPKQFTAAMNLASSTTHILRWCRSEAQRTDSPLSRFRCTRQCWDDVAQAFEIAHNYVQFCRAFPRWHRYQYAAELLSDTEIRFTSRLSDNERRVEAYQTNIRPARLRATKAPPCDTPELNLLVEEVRSTVRKGHLSIRVKRLHDLYAGAYAAYYSSQTPILAVFRRHSSLDLGGYTLGEFQRFYLAMVSIMSTHEHLCLLWDDHPQRFPFDCCVLVHGSNEWTSLIAGLGALDKNRAAPILADLTFGRIRKANLFISPFVPLNSAGTYLGVAYPYVLSSAAEDNILRVCSYIRPEAFNFTTLTKEDEMRQTIKDNVRPRVSVSGPIKLYKGIPDLDLFIEDPQASIAVIAETKWLRSPMSNHETQQQDKELRKGVRQIRAIRNFLSKNDEFLLRRGKASRRLSEFKRVIYCVIARDHLIFNDPSDVPVFAFDAFIEAMKEETDRAADYLLSLDWLPRRDRDFTIRINSARVPGVQIHYESYRRLYG